MTRLSPSEVHRLDPYAFLAVLGRRVIHPVSAAKPRVPAALQGVT
jgi:hypothetical protein